MRLAVFTSKYPARVATFFERDMRALLEAGIDVEIFPIYPLDPEMWRYGLGILDEKVLPREKIHHLGLAQSLNLARPRSAQTLGTALRDAARLGASAMRYGPRPLAKTSYVLPKAWAWAKAYASDFDHVLAYWGNYAATCAYAFHRLIRRPVPFSIWLHAGADLYETPIYLRQKLLYANHIITCCEFNRGFIKERYPDIFPAIAEKISVRYHGIDFADFPYQPDNRPVGRIVAVGRLAREKGFDYLLRAAHDLLQRGVNIEVEVVGDGDEAGPLKSLADKLGIAERVRFRGWLSFKEVQEAMRGATVLVHPSDGLGDGLPNVIREAMALGTPVIASSIAGIPEALDGGRCGMLVPPRDVKALAHAINVLMSNPQMRRSLADSARRLAEEKFDMWRIGKSFADELRAAQPLARAS